MYGFHTSKPEVAIASAMVYWCYRCRSASSQATGMETWKRVQAIAQNAARPSEDLDDYLEQLCRLLSVDSLRPDVWRQIVGCSDRIAILRADRRDDGTIGDIQEIESDQAIAFDTWNELLDHHRSDGLTDDDVLRTAEKYPHVIATLVRLRRDQDFEIGIDDTPETITVTAL